MDVTSYGHCYQTLIYLAMRKVGIKEDEIEDYYNLLSYFSYYLFTHNKKTFNETSFAEYLEKYKKNYIFETTPDKALTLLESSMILIKDSIGNIEFKYPYIYYYFTSKHIADKEINNIKLIQSLCENLQKKENTFILLFLTHHSKNPDVINEIIMHTMYIYENLKPVKFTIDETKFMTDVIDNLTDIILENVEPEEYRKRDLSEKDNIELHERQNTKKDTSHANEDIEIINKAFKSIDINGQLLKNRSGSIKISTLEEIVEEAYLLCLRLLQFFLNDISKSEKMLVDSILSKLEELEKDKKNKIRINSENIDKDFIKKFTGRFFSHITYFISYHILDKTAFAIGNDKLSTIYEKISVKIDSPAATVITFLIKTKYQRNIDTDEVKSLVTNFEKNPFIITLIKKAVIQYIYMHKINYKDKQKLTEILNIPIQGQLRIENKFNK